jgi:hypothetical protein
MRQKMLGRLQDWAKKSMQAVFTRFSILEQAKLLQQEARSKEGVASGRMGFPGLSVPVTLVRTPFPAKKLAELVNKLDEQDHSRAPNRLFQQSSIGNTGVDHSFVLTMSGRENARAIEVRKQDLMKKFNRDNIFNLTKNALQKLATESQIGRREILRMVIEVLAKTLCNVDTLPWNAADIILRASELSLNPLYVFSPDIVSRRATHSSQIAFQRLISEIKQSNPQAEIPNDSIFATFIAADTLARSIMLAFPYLRQQRKFVDSHDWPQGELTVDILESTALRAFYLETLRVSDLDVMRQTKSGLAEFGIPPNTLVVVNLNSFGNDPAVHVNPDRFNPERYIVGGEKSEQFAFSAGRRACPAQGIAAPVIFQTCVAFFAQRELLPLDDERYQVLPRHPLRAILFDRGSPIGGYSRRPEFFLNYREQAQHKVSEDCASITINVGTECAPSMIRIGSDDKAVLSEVEDNVALAKNIIITMIDPAPLQLQVSNMGEMIDGLKENEKHADDLLPIIRSSQYSAKAIFQAQLIMTFPPGSKSVLLVASEVARRLAEAGVPPACPPDDHVRINDYVSASKQEEKKIVIKDDIKTDHSDSARVQTQSRVPTLRIGRTFEIFNTIYTLIEKTSKTMEGELLYIDPLNRFSEALRRLHCGTYLSPADLRYFCRKSYLEVEDCISDFLRSNRSESSMDNFEKLDLLVKVFFHRLSFHESSAENSNLPRPLYELCVALAQFLYDYPRTHVSARDMALARLQQYNEGLEAKNGMKVTDSVGAASVGAAAAPSRVLARELAGASVSAVGMYAPKAAKAVSNLPTFSWGSNMHRHII